MPELPRPVATVSELHLHPVKSCRRIEVEEVVVDDVGLVNDRCWQIVDADGAPVTQRQHDVLAVIQPELLAGGLRLSHPLGHRSSASADIEIPEPDASSPPAKAQSLFRIDVDAWDAGDAAAAWLTELLGEPVRLARLRNGWELPPGYNRWRTPVGFVDASPTLVASTDSFQWLADRASEPFPLNRFRPNIVISGADPWAEDTWAHFTVGPADCRGTLPWPRCSIPQIEQDNPDDGSARTRHTEPARVLKSHRWCESAPTLTAEARSFVEGNGLFGIGCDIAEPGAVVTIGDPVTVIERADPIIQVPE